MSGALVGVFHSNARDLAELLTRVGVLDGELEKLGKALLETWARGGKVMIAGNGGSAADAMHFAEELLVRFHKNRKALAAIALCDAAAITCAGNDFGYDRVFSRQVEGLGAAGDLLIVMSTSGNSANLVEAVKVARQQGVQTAMFSGKDGGVLHGLCDIELIVPSQTTHHIQEVHKVLFHAVCQWVDTVVD